MIIEVTWLMAIAVCSGLLTGLILYISRSGWLMDIPNARSAHNRPVARGGGLAIVICFYLAMLIWIGNESNNYVLVFLGGLWVAGVGFWDDHRHIPARWRILMHVIAACWSVYWLGFQGFEYGFAVVVLVWCLNLFNFMDGIDGIAGLEAVFFTVAFALLSWSDDPQIAAIAMMLAVAVCGFLCWNVPPAKIFMGDVGSGFLGFMLGILILSQGLFSPLFFGGIILFAVFITDATLTLLIRIYRGECWYQAHSCHAYQHKARQIGHFKTTGSVLLINLFWLLPLALLTTQMPDFAYFFLLLTYIPLVVLAWNSGAGYD